MPGAGEKPVMATEKKAAADPLRSLTGGAYIPPAKLKMMQEAITDKGSEQYQRINWERLKKKIHRQVNIVNTANLVSVVRDLLQENIIRGKGLLARSVIQAQSFSPAYSNVYAALVAVINSKFPHIGELILKRLIVQFKRSFHRNDKATTITVSKFIAHLLNQQVLHEVLALELIILMLENPTEDSVEVAITFLKECGAKLSQLSPRGINSIFDRLRNILMDSDIDKRIQYTIEAIFTIRRDHFKAFPAVTDELDLIDEEDQVTHTMSLEDAVNPENELNVFKFDPEFDKNEAMYDDIRREIVGEPGETSDEESDYERDEQADEENEKDEKPPMTIIDSTEQNLVAFRRNVYLTIQSSLDFQEAAHKLLKLELKPGQDAEMCNMIVDCCAQQRTYENFYGLLAERFCHLRKEFQEAFERIARDTYNTIHRFEITKLRNMARLVAHLLCSDAISWNVLSEISLCEEDTTSAGRVYLKILFQELAEFKGMQQLLKRIRDPSMQVAFDKIFPRDNPNNSRFSVNFFTSIGLGVLTMDLRNHLTKGKKKTSGIERPSSSSGSSDSGSDSDSDSESSSGSSSSSSETESSGSSVDEKTTAKELKRTNHRGQRESSDERKLRSKQEKQYTKPQRRQSPIEKAAVKEMKRTNHRGRRESSEEHELRLKGEVRKRESRRRKSPDEKAVVKEIKRMNHRGERECSEEHKSRSKGEMRHKESRHRQPPDEKAAAKETKRINDRPGRESCEEHELRSKEEMRKKESRRRESSADEKTVAKEMKRTNHHGRRESSEEGKLRSKQEMRKRESQHRQSSTDDSTKAKRAKPAKVRE